MKLQNMSFFFNKQHKIISLKCKPGERWRTSVCVNRIMLRDSEYHVLKTLSQQSMVAHTLIPALKRQVQVDLYEVQDRPD